MAKDKGEDKHHDLKKDAYSSRLLIFSWTPPWVGRRYMQLIHADSGSLILLVHPTSDPTGDDLHALVDSSPLLSLLGVFGPPFYFPLFFFLFSFVKVKTRTIYSLPLKVLTFSHIGRSSIFVLNFAFTLFDRSLIVQL